MASKLIKQIVSMYLYGTNSPPSNLLDDHLIRPTGTTSVTVDAFEFMTSHGGRFAVPGQFTVIKQFFNVNTTIPQGSYTLSAILGQLGLSASAATAPIDQKEYSSGFDYVERVFVFNNTNFSIQDSTNLRFVVAANGERYIDNLKIVPQTDNFNFVGGDAVTDSLNEAIQPFIDPSSNLPNNNGVGLGRIVTINFSDNAPIIQKYIQQDYTDDVLFISSEDGPEDQVLFSGPVFAFELNRLWGADITQFLDNKNRPILYGTNSSDTLSADDVDDIYDNGSVITGIGQAFIQDLEQYKNNGVAILGGQGIDTITGGVYSDALYGGTGNDIISGGNGNDNIYGGANNDTLYGGADNDIIEGNENNDTLDGGGGKDYLSGGTGQDTYIWDEAYTGSITIDGGSGNDIIKLVGQTTDDLFGHYTPTGSGAIYSKESSSWIYILGLKESPDAPVYFQNPDGLLVPIKTVFNDPSEPRSPGNDNPAGGPAIDPDSIPMFDPRSPDYSPVAPWIPRLPDDMDDGHGEASVRGDGSPLIIDMDGDGVEMTDLNVDPVYWDIDNDGFKDASAWVKADDALLVIDRNGNGVIDNHSELFGTQAIDGFTKLTELDSNADNKISNLDAQFSELKIWQDLNQDGISQTNELKNLTDAHIVSIDLNDTIVNYTIAGNTVTNTSTVLMDDNSTKTIVDAWFKYDDTNTFYDGEWSADIRALFLPTLRGYGEIKDLHIAMSQDENLLLKVQDLSALDLSTILNPTFDFDYKFRDVLYNWSGNTGPMVEMLYDSKDGLVGWWENRFDERKTKLIDDLSGRDYTTGIDYVSGRVTYNPPALFDTWQHTLNNLEARFLAQTTFKSLFNGSPLYNSTTDLVTGITGLSSTGLNAIAALIDASSDKSYGWTLVARVVEGTIGISNLSIGDSALLDGKITTSLPGQSLSSISSAITNGLAVKMEGIDGVDNTLTGTASDDYIIGRGLNDTLTGGRGDDFLYGKAGNDTYRGGAGDDYIADDDLISSNNNDTYIYDSGYDAIKEFYGNDKIVMAAGITLSDILIDRPNATGNSSVIINVNGLGTLTVLGQYGYYGVTGNESIETLEFSGGSTINLTTLDNPQNGTGGNDTITGADRAYYLKDYLFGDAGNDTLNGGLGNDVLEGGYGDDSYIYTSGVDTIIEMDGADDQIVFNNTYNPALFTVGFNSLQDPYDIRTQDLNIFYDGNLAIIIKSGLNSNYGNFVEKIVVTGVQTINISSLDFTHNGTDASETIYGIDAPAIQNNIIHGLGGNDYITGREGSDTIYGDDGNDTLEGNNGVDTLYGGAGNDNLNGGAGNDTLVGGIGNDIYVLDSLSDIVTENANEGTDTIQVTLTYTLGANIENLTLTGTTNTNGTGNALNNFLMGNQWNNILTGGDGDDTLNGNVGDDTLVGGIGNDIYVVDTTGDIVTENASQGTDTVQTEITYTLGSNVENLTLTSYFAINGTGNSLNNILMGNGNINILTGAGGHDTLDGGTGNDTMIGGAGDDNYFVDDANDIVTENSAEGTDTVNSSITYVLSANLENLTLIGAYAINGTGNSLNNIITGNSGINILTGGAGNDTYVIDSASDTAIENASEGTDLVQSSAAAYTLVTNVENLTLIGTGNINGTGNTVNNIILGNIGNNTLDGGTGNDTLSGGAGNDLYIIDSGDTVTELASEGMDTVQLAFTGYTLGANVENLTLTGASAISGTGNSLNNILTGNSGVNTLTGAGGNDTLDGGLGNDTLIGGQGDDTYYLDTASDVVTENTSEGIDTVYVAATYTLSTNLEHLTLTGSAAINGTGNGSDNILIGNSGVNTLTGANGNDTLDGGLGNDTLVGGAGDDIYYVDATDVVTEATSSGTDLVRSTAATYTLASNVENLTLMGTGNISGTGNTLANILTGNIGNNTLSGGTGADTMIGGLGNDIYVVDNASDVVTENANEGNDTVQTVLAYTLGANVENLTLTSTGSVAGTGNALNNILTGNSGTNTLTGGDGNDTLDGGTGNDTMIGGIGDDIFVMNVATDIVTEAANEGTDTVRAAFTYTLLTNFENLTLTGTSNINATGNAYSNILIGNTGNNVLTGGTGNDTMSGGLGNDTYVVDSALDIVIENAAEGTDLIQSSVTYILSNNFENLTLTGSAAINGIGNDLVNTITGNTGNNILNGGLGNDTLIGGTGDDIYIVDAADIVTEAASSGTDLVRSSAATYTLATNVENLTLMGYLDINGTGNTANNILTGNVGNNTLNGGTGVDTLIGGLGNDTYVIDTLTDTLSENASEGIDTVQSTVTYTLLSNFENLTLTGTSNINGTGNAADNILTGNTGNNTLTGNDGNDTLYGLDGSDTLSGGNNNDTLYGGAGLDAMTGGAGADIFVFQAASAFSNIDTISDFSTAQTDKLNIHDLLVGYTAGVSNIDDFVTVTTVGSNTSFLVDRDGSGGAYSDQAIATLNSITGLTVSDLFTNGHLIV